MKNRIIKYTLNGVILAAVAVIGVAAYQIGTSPTEDKIIQEMENPDGEEYAMLEEGMAEDTDLDYMENSQDENFLEGEISETSLLNEEIPDEDVSGENIDFEFSDELSEMDLPEEKRLEEAGSNSVESEMTASEEVAADSKLIDIEVAEEDWESVDTSSQLISQQLHFSETTEMEWPAHGTILLDYNMDQTVYFPTLDQYKLSSAIAVQAMEGTPVMAAASGMVYDISTNAQTGTTLTMELGDGYQAIYGQLKDLTVEEGEMIEKGTVIGYIDTPTKYYSVEGSNLYFSMKRNGEFVNPIEYLPE